MAIKTLSLKIIAIPTAVLGAGIIDYIYNFLIVCFLGPFWGTLCHVYASPILFTLSFIYICCKIYPNVTETFIKTLVSLLIVFFVIVALTTVLRTYPVFYLPKSTDGYYQLIIIAIVKYLGYLSNLFFCFSTLITKEEQNFLFELVELKDKDFN